MPQGTLRMMVVGTSNRPATGDELARMQQLLADGLREGAVGMSSGLTYTPGMFASTDELVALCEVLAGYGGYYAPHQRSYGKGALEAYGEMVEVARRSGCALHPTHAVMNFAPNAGRGDELVAMIDKALASGVDVTTDTYPYLPGATTLAAILPSWTAEGGPDALLARLRDPSARQRITYELEQVGSDGCHGCVVEWDTIEIGGVRTRRCPTRSARPSRLSRTGKPAADVFFEILLADDLATSILQHVGHEENVRAIMRHPSHTGGSDGIPVGGKPHPRSWGTFAVPRALRPRARRPRPRRLHPPPHRPPRPPPPAPGSRPGARGVRRRPGPVRPGYRAGRRHVPRARRQAEGIPYVFVNGVPVIDDSHRTAAVPGRAIRRTPTPAPSERNLL